MARRIWTVRNAVAVLLAGALGDLLGTILTLFIPRSPVRDALLFPVEFGFSAIKLNLIILNLTFGLEFRINLLAFILIFFMIFLIQKI